MNKRVVAKDGQVRAEKALFERGHNVTIDWDRCFVEKHNTRVYVTCNMCCSSVNRSVSDLKLGRYDCSSCVLIRYSKTASQNGFTFIGKHSPKKVSIECNLCNTEKVLTNSALYNNSGIECQTCLLDKYSKAADKIGFEFIDKFPTLTRSMARIRCRIDSTEKSVGVTELMCGEVLCLTCRENKYKQALERKNCVFVDSEMKNHRGRVGLIVKYQNSPGEILEANGTSILLGTFTTSTDGQWTTQHSTYLIRTFHNGNVYCKIGTAQDPHKRLRQLKLLGESRVYTLESFSDRFGADRLESELHREFEAYKLNPEIAKVFTGATRKVKHKGKIERVYIKEGVTEYFTHEVFDIIKDRYQLKE